PRGLLRPPRLSGTPPVPTLGSLEWGTEPRAPVRREHRCRPIQRSVAALVLQRLDCADPRCRLMPDPGGQALENQTILVGVDASPIAEKAANFALQLAATARARLLLVFVVPPYMPEAEFPPPNVLEIMETEREAAELTLKELGAKLEGKGVKIATQVLLGNPASELSRISGNPEVAMVTIGKTGKGAIARLLLGSVALSLARSCPKPLVIVP